MRLALFIKIIIIFALIPNCKVEDTNLFSSIKYYYSAKGSWGHNLLSINSDWSAEYLRLDSFYDKNSFYQPGRARGKVPPEIANKILACLQNFTYNPDQKPNYLSNRHRSLFVFTNSVGIEIEQPYPDEQHLELLPAYNEIEELFLQAIQYINEHGNTTYISFEANATLDDKRFVTFTIKINNTGNTAITIENMLNMRELASSFYSKTGVGPRYDKNNTILLNANFDVKQEIIQFVPGEPLLLEFVSKEPINSRGEVSFCIVLHIKEVNDSGEEIATFVTGSIVHKFDLP